MFGRTKKNKAWVVAVDMGYGHQRAALPFSDIAQGGKIITANDYKGIPESDRKIWHDSQRFYEIISRFKKFPVLGDFVFAVFDKFQEIREFYPANESIDAPTLQLKQVYRLFKKKHWGEHLISQLNKNPLPLLCTFFIPAYMAEHWGYAGPIYLVIPDTDVSRAWAPLRPSKSKIRYCVPTQRVADRLRRYGVPQSSIFYTGFPFPKEFTAKNAFQAKQDLKKRLTHLDPRGQYRKRYSKVIKQYVGTIPMGARKPYPVSVTFAIGGAGAQAEIAEKIIESLTPLLKAKKVKLTIIAGVHTHTAVLLRTVAKEHSLSSALGKNLFIVSSPNKKEYFKMFNKVLRTTDILWTKPSELVFYAGLGIPILLAPPIGAQEVFNRTWLLQVGAGIEQMNPSLTNQWMADLVEQGVFAEAAMQGFVEIEKNGAENIAKLLVN